MKKILLISITTFFSYFSMAEGSLVETIKDNKKDGLTGIFVAVPPYGVPLTNGLGVPYKITTYNHSSDPVLIDSINIEFNTEGYVDGLCEIATNFNSEQVNLHFPVYARMDSTGSYHHKVKFGVVQGIPENLKTLQPGQSFDLLFVSSSPLGSGGIGGGCLKPIEESLRYFID
ncbi:hypothetical protein [Aeromonas hydrophila]|uniref:hypothetical protein n=1 Tax=Aeromonas hydrophila TaxID=644 RepID=UPI001F61E6BF|nr:hypothetical protein [Aeromonas hydrophila]UNU29401.1 hypothetical protein GCK65_09890 [Aeromonas hydrophila]